MNVVMLSRYDHLGASSRLRMFQYAKSFKANGFEARQCAFFDNDYLARLYAGRRAGASAGSAYLRRFGQLRGIRNADLLWIEKEALPWVPWSVERGLLPRGIPTVTDYDDAVFHNYDLHPSPIVRRLLGRKIDRVMAASTLVMAGNAYLADRARAAGARRVEIVPTVVDIDVYSAKPQSRGDVGLRIGWIGTPSTWTEYMAPMMPLLADVAASHAARIRVVGPGKAAASHPLLDNLPWSEECEVAQIQSMDIGIMPLSDSPWARGKCGYKLIQYMACGLPVVASPVGVNAEIVEHGVNGFLAATDAEWRSALSALLLNSDLRHRMGAAGRKRVEERYSLQVWGQRVVSLLREAAGAGRK